MKKYEGIDFIEIWDCPSKKGFPTKDSVVITIAICPEKNDNEITTGGYAFKVPGDQHIPRIGRAIAVREMNTNFFDPFHNQYEESALGYIELYKKKHFSNKIMDRIRNLVRLPKAGIKLSDSYYQRRLYEDRTVIITD